MTFMNTSNDISLHQIPQLKTNLSTISSHTTSPNNRIFITNLLFTSFAQLKTNLSTISSHTTSHNNRIFIKMLLFTSFAQLKRNLSTISSHTTSHNNRIFLITFQFIYYIDRIIGKWSLWCLIVRRLINSK